MGDIVIVLNGEKAPISVKNFLRYADEKYYDGTIFHRVMPNFMIQGGGFTAEVDKKEGAHEPIKNEWRNGLKNDRGTISMARTGAPDSATNQFFINVVDNKSLDQPRGGAAYAVFGRVGAGLDVVDKIRNTKCEANPKYPGGAVVPVEPVIITSVTRMDGEEADKARKVCAEADAVQAKRYAAVNAAAAKVTAAAEKSAQEFAPRLAECRSKGKKTPSGLITLVTKAGDGPMPKRTDRVQVHYTGWLTNGTKFDSSVDRGRPFEFNLTGGVIQGWLEGVALMKVGETRMLLIPSALGYGPRGSRPKIPPNAELVFEVQLLAIK